MWGKIPPMSLGDWLLAPVGFVWSIWEIVGLSMWGRRHSTIERDILFWLMPRGAFLWESHWQKFIYKLTYGEDGED